MEESCRVDSRRGAVHETIPATEFIGRMIQHLPPKGFRMVRYYGIYARPVREKIHALVADALQALVRRAALVAEFFARKRGTTPEAYRAKLDERFGKGEMRCPNCGSTKMLLIRIWSKTAGVVYDLLRDGVAPAAVHEQRRREAPMPGAPEQLVFAF